MPPSDAEILQQVVSILVEKNMDLCLLLVQKAVAEQTQRMTDEYVLPYATVRGGHKEPRLLSVDSESIFNDALLCSEDGVMLMMMLARGGVDDADDGDNDVDDDDDPAAPADEDDDVEDGGDDDEDDDGDAEDQKVDEDGVHCHDDDGRDDLVPGSDDARDNDDRHIAALQGRVVFSQMCQAQHLDSLTCPDYC
eukprot:s429_g3.t1